MNLTHMSRVPNIRPLMVVALTLSGLLTVALLWSMSR
jgi:hypothetical protein